MDQKSAMTQLMQMHMCMHTDYKSTKFRNIYFGQCACVNQHLCAAPTVHDQVPVQHVSVPLWQLDGDGNYFVEERTSIALIFSQVSESKTLSTLVPLTGQEHVSCDS